jgi:acyl-CoA reductase-like NAD-dependent aldehyde dehydrogenase
MSETLTPVKPGRLIINGEAVDAADGATFTTINPATEEIITTVAEAGVEDVDRAVRAAHAALEGPWAKMKAVDRSRVLWKLGDLILQNADELARLETMDNGKPITESRYVDIDMVARCFHYFSGWATKLTGDTTSVNPGTFTYTLREPVGVVGAIIPWNFPMIMVGWKVAPALAAGNTIVVKPAELTPLTAIRIAELALEAGVPAGVFNVVPGKGRVAGEALVKHPLVSKISFTGSTEVGKHLMRTAADQLKKVTLELGGKSPNIVFADADLDAALKGATMGIFYGKGEVCAAGSRLLVERSIYDDFVAKLADRAKKMVPSDPDGSQGASGCARVGAADGEGARLRRDRDEGGRAPRGRWPARADQRQGCVRAGDGVRRRGQLDEAGAGGDLRSGARGDPVRRRGRRARQGQRRVLRARLGRVDAGSQEGAHGVAPPAGWHGVDQHLQQL